MGGRQHDRGDAGRLGRAVKLLVLFTEEEPIWGLSDISRESGLAKATCLRTLEGLADVGLVARTTDRRWRLGALALRLGAIARATLVPSRIAGRTMRALSEATAQSVQWVERDGDEALYVEVIEPLVPVRLFIRAGRRAPLYAGASNRVLWSNLGAAERAATLRSRPPRPHTRQTVTDPELLELLGAETRRYGLAMSAGELADFTVEVACGVWGSDGSLTGALGIAGPEHSWHDPAVVRANAEALVAAAEAFGAELSSPPRPKPDVTGFLESSLQAVAVLGATVSRPPPLAELLGRSASP